MDYLAREDLDAGLMENRLPHGSLKADTIWGVSETGSIVAM